MSEQLDRIVSSELPRYVGGDVRLAGWIHRKRDLKSVLFIILRDRGGFAQIVVRDASVRGSLDELAEESVVEVSGIASANVQAPGGVEVTNPSFTVLSAVVEPLVIEMHRPELKESLPVLLDNAAVSLRHPRRQAIFRLTAASVRGFRAALDELDFVEVQTPKIVGASTESGANVFALDYFGRPAFLAQSPQFYKQMMVGVFERVYEVGPVFRAEPHDTARHLAEYVSLDAELGFIEDHRQVMRVLEHVVARMLSEIETGGAVLLDVLDGGVLPRLLNRIPEVHFSDALKMISDSINEDVTGENDLSPGHERWLGQWAAQQYDSDFVFVTGYPMTKRPFYTAPDPARAEYSNSFDLLFRGLELVTGGQRLHRYPDYLAALADRGQSPDSYESYLAAFRAGMPRHGGFAIGLERWTARLTGVANIRETTLFPRDLHRLEP